MPSPNPPSPQPHPPAIRSRATRTSNARNPATVTPTHANTSRVKVWGTAEVVEDDPALLDQLRDPNYPGRVERAIVFHVEAWDVNCHQHIHKRYSEQQIAPIVEELRGRVAELEAKLAEALASNASKS